MKIGLYIKEYTSGERVRFGQILDEVKEMVAEIWRMDFKEAKMELQDVLHFVQLWLYWNFKLDGEVWKCTSESVAKFMHRLTVWRDIYEKAGLPRNVSNFCGNYLKKEKVVRQLAKFGVGAAVAEKAFEEVVRLK